MRETLIQSLAFEIHEIAILAFTKIHEIVLDQRTSNHRSAHLESQISALRITEQRTSNHKSHCAQTPAGEHVENKCSTSGHLESQIMQSSSTSTHLGS